MYLSKQLNIILSFCLAEQSVNICALGEEG